MNYKNPIITGFHPDPSVCRANGKYYLVCSSMQYFPGVPIFESDDLINWKKIGNCLTRPSQIHLEKVRSSGGVFAPTIRYNNGRFYMTTTNDSTHQNFYVWTDDIYGEWSEPVFVDQGGIDPSILFDDDGKVYFMSNGADDEGNYGITVCEIDIDTGKKLSKSKTVWKGSGGRYLEGPHLYKINGRYLLLAAEGGTEYGHMVTYAVSDSVFGEYKGYDKNPVLTNRNLGGYEIQGIGHGDLIEDYNGNWWIVCLGFRQIGQWSAFHHLGRETFLTPVDFNGVWFTAGTNGTTAKEYATDRISDSVVQDFKTVYTFENTNHDVEWCYLRIPQKDNYEFKKDRLVLKGTSVTLDDCDSPTFIGIRQNEFNSEISCDVSADCGEAGITMYMDENAHYDLALRKNGDGEYEVIKRIKIGEINYIQNSVRVYSNSITLKIYCSNFIYSFAALDNNIKHELGTAETRLLSSEVAGGFTGVFAGLYACSQHGGNEAVFSNFIMENKE